MQGDKTIPERTIPSTSVTNTVERVIFFPSNKVVTIRCVNDNGEINDYEADMTTVWQALGVDKKADWKLMFKKVVAIALGLTSNDITGDIWD